MRNRGVLFQRISVGADTLDIELLVEEMAWTFVRGDPEDLDHLVFSHRLALGLVSAAIQQRALCRPRSSSRYALQSRLHEHCDPGGFANPHLKQPL